eukprot:4810148-Pyramimonas_sp.AAC.1
MTASCRTLPRCRPARHSGRFWSHWHHRWRSPAGSSTTASPGSTSSNHAWSTGSCPWCTSSASAWASELRG